MGFALLFDLAQWSVENGIKEMHLGLGDYEFKQLMASYSIPVRGGTLANGGLQQMGLRLKRWGASIEDRGGLSGLPAKLARKYERVALAGTLSA